jgi:hypothetical protein
MQPQFHESAGDAVSAASVESSQKPHAAERQVATGEVTRAVNHVADLYVSRVA